MRRGVAWGITGRDEPWQSLDKLDAIALLKADHRKVEDLFEKFEYAKGAERKKALALEICTELCVHATIEEEIFYPACKGEVEGGPDERSPTSSMTAPRS